MSLESNSVLNFLTGDNNILKQSGGDSSKGVESPKKFLKVNIQQDEKGVWSESVEELESSVRKDTEARNEEFQVYKNEVASFTSLAKLSDDKILNIKNQINQKKELIISKINTAVLAGCSVGIGTSGVRSTVDGVVLGIGVTITRDSVTIKKYEGLDDPSSDIPFKSDETLELTSSNSGTGYATNNININGGSFVGIYKTVFYNPLSTSFPQPDPTTLCQTTMNEVSQLANEIQQLRSQVDEDLINSTNKVKDRKSTSELFVWGYESRGSKVKSFIDDNDAVIEEVSNQQNF